MHTWKKWLLVVVVLSCCVGCDQVTKEIARQTLQGAAPKIWLANIIQLRYTENPGAFLSLGARLSPSARFLIFQIIPGIALSGLLIVGLLAPHVNQWELLLLACFLGGGFSNLLDRALQDGRVSDFLNIGIGSLRTGVFNVADVLIMVGGIGLVLVKMFPPQKVIVYPGETLS